MHLSIRNCLYVASTVYSPGTKTKLTKLQVLVFRYLVVLWDVYNKHPQECPYFNVRTTLLIFTLDLAQHQPHQPLRLSWSHMIFCKAGSISRLRSLEGFDLHADALPRAFCSGISVTSKGLLQKSALWVCYSSKRTQEDLDHFQIGLSIRCRYFLQAEEQASPAVDNDSFSSQAALLFSFSSVDSRELKLFNVCCRVVISRFLLWIVYCSYKFYIIVIRFYHCPSVFSRIEDNTKHACAVPTLFPKEIFVAIFLNPSLWPHCSNP